MLLVCSNFLRKSPNIDLKKIEGAVFEPFMDQYRSFLIVLSSLNWVQDVEYHLYENFDIEGTSLCCLFSKLPTCSRQ